MNHQKDAKWEALWVQPQVHQVNQIFHYSSSLSQEDEDLEEGLLDINDILILD